MINDILKLNASDILARHQSDKATHHRYGPVYDEILSPYRETAENILELGVLEGCSLRAWKDYFIKAVIHGIDCDSKRLFNDNRIISYQADTKDLDGIMKLRDAMPEMDVIIDDASHVPSEQICTLAVFWNKLKVGGLYVVEDIYTTRWLDLFRCFQNATLYDLRVEGGCKDDLMAVMKK